ncbi:MAG: transposase, partial [Bifidobacterium longum]|nr:transposase [Bifidobacterium longum]
MTQKVCIERVEVRGAAPYLGMCVDTVGREMPVWSDNPQVVLDWLCDAWRCRYNQLRTRRMKWNRGRSELVPLGAVVDSR